jgi:hypothetical protein
MYTSCQVARGREGATVGSSIHAPHSIEKPEAWFHMISIELDIDIDMFPVILLFTSPVIYVYRCRVGRIKSIKAARG